MQYNRDEAGVMHPLPKPSVDTGMGLERLAAVLQNVHSNYEIDSFVTLIDAARQTVSQAGATHIELLSPSLKVIADHIRACTFIVVDGVIPSNEGRGYVLRRIARRAIRHGYKLGARRPFFHQLVATLVQEMGEAYPDLHQAQKRVTAVLQQEEERFFQTIANGMEILEQALTEMTRAAKPVLDGDLAFKLHDTFGFPLDLTADVCRERGVSVDSAAFDTAMSRQREQARAAGKFKMSQGLDYSGPETTFHGYEKLLVDISQVVALYVDGAAVGQAQSGDDVVVVLNHTPFYAESGGQMGDCGELRNASSRMIVEDTLKIQAAVFGHHGRVVEGIIKVGDVFQARVDLIRRADTARNHSATHLLHKALREVLGAHVQQRGSLVNALRTRFDFSHSAPVTSEQIRQIEDLVNAEILLDHPTLVRVLSMEEAQKMGAVMLFGEKYGEEVRVLDIGSSRELCGGTHVQRTGEIGFFKIVTEAGIAAGVRRVEALTGRHALQYVQKIEATLMNAASILRTPVAEIAARLTQFVDQQRSLEREIGSLKGRLASSQGDELLKQAVNVEGLQVLAATLEGADAKVLRETLDKLKDKLKTAAIVLACVQDGKVQIAAGVTADSTQRIKAGELVNFVAQQVGGKGGGKPDMAMAGGTRPDLLPAAMAQVATWVQQQLAPH